MLVSQTGREEREKKGVGRSYISPAGVLQSFPVAIVTRSWMDRSLFKVGVEHRQGRRHGHNISKGFEANAAEARGNKLRIRYPCSGSIPGRNSASGHKGNINQQCDVTFPRIYY